MTIISTFRRVLRRVAAFAGRRLPGFALCGAMALFLALSTNAHAQTTDDVCVSAYPTNLCLPQVDDIVLTVGVDYGTVMPSVGLPAASGGSPPYRYFLDAAALDDVGIFLNQGTGEFYGIARAPVEATQVTYFVLDAEDIAEVSDGPPPGDLHHHGGGKGGTDPGPAPGCHQQGRRG